MLIQQLSEKCIKSTAQKPAAVPFENALGRTYGLWYYKVSEHMKNFSAEESDGHYRITEICFH